MNNKKFKAIKRTMNVFERLECGWRHCLDNQWNWWYHLTESPAEMNFEFWHMLNMDMIKYEEEIYYSSMP